MDNKERMQNYENQIQHLITYGAKEEPFKISEFSNPAENDILIKSKKMKDGEPQFILLGQIITYVEGVLRMSTKPGMKSTHTYFTRQSINHWCSTIGVKPQIGRTNQGAHTKDPDSKTYNKKEGRGYDITCPLSIDEAVTLLRYLVRFKLQEGSSKTPIEEYKDVANTLMLDFINRSIPLELYFLEEFSLGENMK